MIDTTELRVYMTRNNNMTISELALKIGKSPATVGRWLEKGDMPVRYADRMIEMLDIPPREATKIFFGLVVA